MSPPVALGDAELFRSLNAEALEDVARLMTAVSFTAGELVFRQGDRGDHLLVVADGELEVLLDVPGRDCVHVSSIGPGQVVGELALLGDGLRLATVRAVTPTTGWALARTVFEILRHDVRPAASQVVRAIGRQAVRRLDGLYRRCADEVSGAPSGDSHHPTGIGEVSREPGETDYLGGILFFRDFDREQIVEVTRGMPRLAVPRGAVLTMAGERPAALWIVARGAVETTMRGAGVTHSLRLAGPGRAIGHSA